MTKVYEHTETKHFVEDRITKEQAFEIFRQAYTSTKCLVYDDFMVYGSFPKQFADSTVQTAKAIIRRKNLPLKASAVYTTTDFTLVIEEKQNA